MPYYKDLSNGIHYLSDEDLLNIENGRFDPRSSEWIEITQDEADVILNPPLTLEQMKVIKIAQLKQLCQNDINADVIVGVNAVNYTWQADIASLDEVMRKILAVNANLLPSPTHWRDKDNIMVPINLIDLTNIAAAIATKYNGAKENLFNCEDAVNAILEQGSPTLNQAAIDAIVW